MRKFSFIGLLMAILPCGLQLEANTYYRWKTCQEKAGGQVKFDRGVGGILQHIRFALVPVERLAEEQAAVRY